MYLSFRVITATPAEPLTDSHRQDLFVILRDFSGLTQVLVPQEEVRWPASRLIWKVSAEDGQAACVHPSSPPASLCTPGRVGLLDRKHLSPLFFLMYISFREVSEFAAALYASMSDTVRSDFTPSFLVFSVCRWFESSAVPPHGGVSHPGDWDSPAATSRPGQQGSNNSRRTFCVQSW